MTMSCAICWPICIRYDQRRKTSARKAATARAARDQFLSDGAGGSDHSWRGEWGALSAGLSHSRGGIYHGRWGAHSTVAVGMGDGAGRGISAGLLQPVGFLGTAHDG